MNLRVLAIPFSFAAFAVVFFIALNFVGTRERGRTTDQSLQEPIQLANLDEAGEQQIEGSSQDISPEQEARVQEGESEASQEPMTDEPEIEASGHEDDSIVQAEGGEEEQLAEADLQEQAVQEAGTNIVLTPETAEPDRPEAGMPQAETPETTLETQADDQSNGLQQSTEAVQSEPSDDASSTIVIDEEIIETGSNETPAVGPETSIEEIPITSEPIELVTLPLEDQPRFGRTTVESDGTLSILQGEGVPGSVLEILVDGQVLISMHVNPTGGWNLYQPQALPSGLNRLSLRTRLADGRVGVSDQGLAVFLPDDGGRVKGALIEDGHVTVLNAPRFVSKLAIEGLIYNGGGLTLFGKAPAGAEISFVGGNSPSALISSSGVWSLNLGASATGTLIQRNPVTGQDVEAVSLSLPLQPILAEGEATGLAGGVAFNLDGQVLLLF